ncbi:aminopeptidase N [Kitasatospora kazusensis]|uniref:Aminopeptidase N n=1 Tax=Kitasatospora kazusensis TaxID=407974 RepID=A0ABN2ZTF7_9ACTN
MPGDNLTREEAGQRSGLITVDGYAVALDLRSAMDPDCPTFRSVSTIDFRCARPGDGTFVDLIAPSVDSVLLNGERLDPATVFDGTRISLSGPAAVNRLVVTADCAYSRSGEGLHRFVDPLDGEVYLYTQHEPAEARRVFAVFEQPDLKAPFTITVTAPEHWTVASNSHQGEPDAGTWRFAPTRPIAGYLSAIVAGPYHLVRDRYTRTLEGGSTLEIPLTLLCRASIAEHLDAEELFTLTRQGLDFFHDQFGFDYPFGGYAQAFVPEYNMGAMENPGCVVLREEFLFRGRATDAQYQTRANVVLHEMAHMWFGGLVTMQWWDDLWLKESFADFMATFSMVEATRFDGGWVAFANRSKSWAYHADQLPTTHPIAADIPDLRSAGLNFDGITYAKGASVLKQLAAYVGRSAFLDGARLYFRRHAYGTARLADLLAVLAETSGRDLTAWAHAWLQTSGVNTLTPQVCYDEDGRIAELAVRQQATPEQPELRPHRIAVGLYRLSAAGTLERYARAEAELAGPRTVVAELAGAGRPDLVVVNDEDLGYCLIRFDETSLATLRDHLGSLPDPLTRAVCWTALWNMARDGLLPARDFLAMVLRFAGQESDIGVLQSLHTWATQALERFTAPTHREEARRLLGAGARRELAAAEPGSGHQLAWARFLAAVASTPPELVLLGDLLSGAAAVDGLDIDQELRWSFLELLAAHGSVGEEELAAELDRDNTAAGRLRLARCLAARPLAEAKKAAWTDTVESTRLSRALVAGTVAGLVHPAHRELLAPYAARYFEVIERLWSERPAAIGTTLVRGLFPALQVSEATVRAADAWLAEHPDAAPPLRRLVLEGRDELVRSLRAQSRDRDIGTA